MDLFDQKNTEELSNTIQQLDEQIGQRQTQVSALNDELNGLSKTIEELKRNYLAKAEELKQKQDSFLLNLGKKRDEIARKLKQLEKDQQELDRQRSANEEEINEKIDGLKKRKTQLVSEREELEEADYLQRKENIEKRLSDLREERKQAGIDYSNRTRELRDKFDELLKQRNDSLEELKRRKEEYIVEGRNRIEDLSKQIEQTRLGHENAMKDLGELQLQKLNALKEEEDARIAEKKEELDAYEIQYNLLSGQKQKRITELDDLKNRQQEELQSLENRLEEEKTALQKEIDQLNLRLEEKTSLYHQEKEDLDSRYASIMNDLEDLRKTLEEKKAKRSAEIREELSHHSEQQRQIYESYLSDLDQDFLEEKNQRDEVLNLLNTDLAQEEKQLQERNIHIQERLDQRTAEYDNEVQTVDDQIEIIRQELSSLQSKQEETENGYIAQIESLKAQNEAAFSDKKADYEQELELVRNDYRQRYDSIESDIGQLKDGISDLGRQIEQILNDSDQYSNDHQIRLNELQQEQESYRQDTEDRKEKMNGEIASLESRLEEENRSFAQRCADAEQARIDLEQAHEADLRSLEEEHDAQLIELKQKHEEDLSRALQDHQQKMKELQDSYQSQMEETRENYRSRQNTYDEEAAAIEQKLEEIHQASRSRIAQLKDEGTQLQESIGELKIKMEEEETSHVKQIEELDRYRQDTLAQMEKQKEEELLAIEEKYETIPMRELESIREEYEQKQEECLQIRTEADQRRDELDQQETALRQQLEQERQLADHELSLKTSDLEEVRAQTAKKQQELEDESLRLKEELERFRSELEQSLLQIGEQRKKEYEELHSRLDQEYAQTMERYQGLEADAEERNAQELHLHEEDMKARTSALEALIEEIALRKQKVETECQQRTEAAREETAVMQRQLNELLVADERKRDQLSAELEHRKDVVSAEIERIKEAYRQIRSEKTGAYDRYLAQVREQCSEIRKEIASLEEKKQKDLVELSDYEQRKRRAMEEARVQTSQSLDDITMQIENISQQIRQTNEDHEQRMNYIRTQIAATMSEYDGLIKTKPEVIAAAENSEEFDLSRLTQQMKEKTDELERMHESVMLELGRKRDEILDQAAREINELEAGKELRLKDLEDQISGVSLAYDALNRDEKLRKDLLSEQIAKANEEQKLFLDNMHKEELTAIEDFENEKFRLDQFHAQSLKESTEQFHRLSEDLRTSFEQLMNERGVLIKDLDKIVERYKDLDDEIAGRELQLKYECNSRLLDARKLFEDDRNRQIRKLNELDVLHDVTEDLFKI